MYGLEISERVTALKREIASLRHTDEVYTRKLHHTLNEALEHMARMERVQQILDELTTLTKRKYPSG